MLPALELPALDALPDPVAVLDYGGQSGTIEVSIDLIRGLGRLGAVPECALQYVGPGSDGVFGRGWTVAMPSITRGNGRRLPRYRDAGPLADGYRAAGHGELVPMRDASGFVITGLRDGHEVTRFRPRVESGFARLERWRELATGLVHWRETTRQDVTRIYGRSAECRIADPADPHAIAEWLLEEEHHPHGHVLQAVYKPEDSSGVPASAPGAHDANRHLKRVRWANARPGELGGELFELVFDYGEHDLDDPGPEEIGSWDLRADPRCSRRAGFELHTRRLCRRVLLFNSAGGHGPQLLRAYELQHDSTATRSLLTRVVMAGYTSERAELPAVQFEYAAELKPGPVRRLESGEALGSAGAWLDLDADALAGRLTRDRAGTLIYRPNLGAGRLGPPLTLPAHPAATEPSAGGAGLIAQPFADGRTCVLDVGSGPGFQDRDATGRWGMYTTFGSAPTAQPTARESLDLDGDGLADTVTAGATDVRWRRFGGREGWSSDEAGGSEAIAALQDRTGTILVADMTGDGLSDLVQVQPGRVRYWPSFGYGRFGAPVEMASAPELDGPDEFDPNRVRLVDLDGTGPADLLYLGADGLACYANEAGNGFAARTRLPTPGPLSALDDLAVLDVTGAGGQCLVFTSDAPGREPTEYIELTSRQPAHDRSDELTSAQPAHSLSAVRDRRGLTTSVRYTTAALLMVSARRHGIPWVSTAPVPLSVVAEVRQIDDLTGETLVSTFDYRHACYDDVDRELRGFGYVARRDAQLPPPDPDPDRATPPVPVREVKTWYHAGLAPDGLPVAEHVASEFYAGDPDRPAHPVTAFETDGGVSARELLRALQGRPVHEEAYGLTADAASLIPRVTIDYAYLVRALQPGQGEWPASVTVFERETVQRSYEQVPDDPRVQHRAALDIDAFGDRIREVEINYPRRRPEFPAQSNTRAVLIERELLDRIDDPDSYLLGLPISERRYEIGPLAPAAAELYRPDDLAALLADPRLREDPFESAIDPRGPPQRRLLTASETRYWSDDLERVSPPGVAGRLALPALTRQAVITAAMATAEYAADVDELPALGYELEEGLWWAPGPLQRYDPGRFALPVSTHGLLRGTRSIGYDSHALFVVHTTDEVGNEESAEPDYAALAIRSITDANATTRSVTFDPLGLATTMTVVGPGDRLTPPPTFEIDRDLLAWQREGKAASMRVTARPAPDTPRTDRPVEIALLDGRWREIERLQRAEPEFADGGVRWASAGRAVLTGGTVVRQYHPDWVEAPGLRREADIRAPVIRTALDEEGRPTAVALPDGTRTRTVRSAWRIEQWDAVDWVRGSRWEAERRAAGGDDARAADAAWALAETPFVEHLDPAGDVIAHVDDLGGGHQALTVFARALDGQLTSVTDPRSIAAEARLLDMRGDAIRVHSSASGLTRSLRDAEGRPALQWGAAGQRQRLRYDPAGRPVERAFAVAGGWRVAERFTYGDETPDPALLDRGRLRERYDGAGRLRLGYDKHGNITSSARTLRAAISRPADWTSLDEALLGDTFTTLYTFDDLGRLISRDHGDLGAVHVQYGQRGLPAQVRALIAGTEQTVLRSASYDAAGRQLQAILGNGAVESAGYDAASGRPQRLTTLARGRALRDQTLTYDPVGNPLVIRDAAQQRRFFTNAVVTPDRLFTYDAVYRLASATGREAALRPVAPGANDVPAVAGIPGPRDLTAVRGYTDTYAYDAAGNLASIVHAAGAGSYTTRYDIAPDADRVTQIRDGSGNPVGSPFEYDLAGNDTTLGTLTRYHWDDDNRLTQVDLQGGGTAYHAYDAAGLRAHTVIDRRGGLREERVRLDGSDHWQRTSPAGTVDSSATRLHVSDGPRTLAVLEQRRAAPHDSPATISRYQHAEITGSVVLETNDIGDIISFEEFRPYGASAYRAAVPTAPPKPFRFKGAERDDNTGLDLMGVRSYAWWLGRWISPDPGGMLDGTNRYWFARSNPVTLTDPSGFQSVPAAELLSRPLPNFVVSQRGFGGGAVVTAGWEDPVTATSQQVTAYSIAVGASARPSVIAPSRPATDQSAPTPPQQALSATRAHSAESSGGIASRSIQVGAARPLAPESVAPLSLTGGGELATTQRENDEIDTNPRTLTPRQAERWAAHTAQDAPPPMPVDRGDAYDVERDDPFTALQVPLGTFESTFYQGMHEAVDNPDNSMPARIAFGVLAAIDLPAASIEWVARGVINTPHDILEHTYQATTHVMQATEARTPDEAVEHGVAAAAHAAIVGVAVAGIVEGGRPGESEATVAPSEIATHEPPTPARPTEAMPAPSHPQGPPLASNPVSPPAELSVGAPPRASVASDEVTRRLRPLRPGEADALATSGNSPASSPTAGSRYSQLAHMSERFRRESSGNPADRFGGRVRWLTRPEERAAFEVRAADGRLYDAQGHLFDTTTNPGGAIYVMDADGRIYATVHHGMGEFHHSSFLAGGDVAAAGHIEVSQGVVISVNRASGHYRTEEVHLQQFLSRLRESGIYPQRIGQF